MDLVANMMQYGTTAQQENGFVGGSGIASQADVDNLVKALEATHLTGNQSMGLTTASGAALKYESLDNTMRILTFAQDNIVIWKNIPKKRAKSTVEEYNTLNSYGQDRGGFYREGELPMGEDSVYVRRSQLVKYIGVTRAVSHQMMLVEAMSGNGGGNAMQSEITNGTLWVMRKLEQTLIRGNAAYIPEQFNGLYAQHSGNDLYANLNAYHGSETIVDCRGSHLLESHLEQGAEAIVENYGLGTQFYAPPKVLSDFAQTFYGNKFFGMNPDSLKAGIAGQRIQQFQSQYGNIGLNWNIFQNPDAPRSSSSVSVMTTAASSPMAPSAPTYPASGASTPVGSDTSSDWASTDAGNYIYAVEAGNRFGVSALAVLATTAAAATGSINAVVTGGAIDLTFTPTSDANEATTFYTIYRSTKGATDKKTTTFYPLFKVSAAELAAGYDGAAAGSVRDRNRLMPNCSEAFLIQQDSSVFEFAELAPLTKMDLSVNGPAFRFMLLQYGTPLLYMQKRMVRFINIGRYTAP